MTLQMRLLASRGSRARASHFRLMHSPQRRLRHLQPRWRRNFQMGQASIGQEEDSLIGETIHERFPFRAGLRIRVPCRNPIWGGDGLLKLGTGGVGNRDASSRNEARSRYAVGRILGRLQFCWRHAGGRTVAFDSVSRVCSDSFCCNTANCSCRRRWIGLRAAIAAWHALRWFLRRLL